jgi:proteasome lid subunit RPN8/RPN11
MGGDVDLQTIDRMSRAEVPGPILERIRRRAEAAYPEECCGFLFGQREEERVRVQGDRAAANVAEKEERTRRFIIEPRTLLRVMREERGGGDEVVGFYHSHPDHPAELSPTDLTFASLWPRTIWLIVPVKATGAGQERAWWLPARSDGTRPREVAIAPPGAQGRTSTKIGGGWT